MTAAAVAAAYLELHRRTWSDGLGEQIAAAGRSSLGGRLAGVAGQLGSVRRDRRRQWAERTVLQAWWRKAQIGVAANAGFVGNIAGGTFLVVDRQAGSARNRPTDWADRIQLGFGRRRSEPGRQAAAVATLAGQWAGQAVAARPAVEEQQEAGAPGRKAGEREREPKRAVESRLGARPCAHPEARWFV